MEQSSVEQSLAQNDLYSDLVFLQNRYSDHLQISKKNITCKSGHIKCVCLTLLSMYCTVGSKIIRALEIVRVKKLIPNAVL